MNSLCDRTIKMIVILRWVFGLIALGLLLLLVLS